MSRSHFRDLEVWQRARVLARDVYHDTRTFPRQEMFGLTQQMRRAALSILCNIAERQGRWSRSEARHFMLIARGSACELEAQLVIAQDLDYLSTDRAESRISDATRIARMLSALIRYYEQRSRST
jgi:four helix bundle protein